MGAQVEDAVTLIQIKRIKAYLRRISINGRLPQNYPGFSRMFARPLSAGLLSFVILAAFPAHAQAPGPKEDDVMTRARQTYEALPQADRRAIQDNLVWTGIYKSGVDGEFGRLTFNAMRAYANKRSGSEDGILSSADRTALAAEAAKAKAAVEFRIVQEPRAGVTIGIPQKILSRRSDSESGARFDAADKGAGLETFRMKESEASLQTLYDNYRAPAPNRRVTYSVLRPEFLVVAAETPSRSYYTRVARGTAGTEPLLRGFTISWPKAQQARFEILTVAIANAFDPFGQSAVLAKPGDPRAPGGSTPGKENSRPGGPVIAPPAPRLSSNAVAFAPNRYIAILPDPVCTDARIGPRPARLMRHDPASGLALFDVPGGSGIRLRAPAHEPVSHAAVVTLFASADESGKAAPIAAGVGEIAELTDTSRPARVLAPVPADASGGLVLSRKGELFGLVAGADIKQRQIAGAPPPASRMIVQAGVLGSFLAASGLELVPAQANAPEASAGKLASEHRTSIEPLWCVSSAGSK